MAEEDLTQVMALPDAVVEVGSVTLRARERPQIGVRSIGDTHFGSTIVGQEKGERETNSSIPAPVPRATSASSGAPSVQPVLPQSQRPPSAMFGLYSQRRCASGLSRLGRYLRARPIVCGAGLGCVLGLAIVLLVQAYRALDSYAAPAATEGKRGRSVVPHFSADAPEKLEHTSTPAPPIPDAVPSPPQSSSPEVQIVTLPSHAAPLARFSLNSYLRGECVAAAQGYRRLAALLLEKEADQGGESVDYAVIADLVELCPLNEGASDDD